MARAHNRVPDAYIEDLCFDAQQAAEKALKALMIRRGIDFPYIHDLARLMDILEAQGERIPATVQRAVRLTRYAVSTRYPGPQEPVTEQDYAEAIELAEGVLRWAEDNL